MFKLFFFYVGYVLTIFGTNFEEQCIKELAGIQRTYSPKIFVCHADHDPSDALGIDLFEREICILFERCGCTVIKDNPNLEYGGDIEMFMHSIKEKEPHGFCYDFVLVLMTKRLQTRFKDPQSGVRKEIYYVSDRLKMQKPEEFLIPFLLEHPLEDCIPVTLRPYLFYNVSDRPNKTQLYRNMVTCLVGQIFKNDPNVTKVVEKYPLELVKMQPYNLLRMDFLNLPQLSIQYTLLCCALGVILEYFVFKNEHPVFIPLMCFVYYFFQPTQTLQIFNEQHKDLFLNRSHKLAEAANILRKYNRVVIHGPGGAGKTRIAQKLITKGAYGFSLEVRAENMEMIFTSLYSFFKSTEKKSIIKKIDDAQDPIKTAFEEFYKFLKAQKNWVVVVDNVVDFEVFNQFKITENKLCGKGFVIVTTQNTVTNHNDFSKHCYMNIGELSAAEAKDLFSKRSKRWWPEEETKKILEKVPLYPLDVITAALVLDCTEASANEFLRMIHQPSPDLEAITKPSDYEKTRFSIIRGCINALTAKSRTCLPDLLKFSLCLPTDLKRELLSEHNRVHIIMHLKRYSLLSITGDKIEIHPTFQKIMRILIAHEIPEEEKVKAFQDVWAYSLNFYARDSHSKSKLFNALNLLNFLLEAMDDLKLSEENYKKIRWHILNKIGEIYLYLGNFPKAKEYYDRLEEEVKVDEQVLYVRSLIDRSSLYWILDEYDKSITLSEKALKCLTPNSLERSDCYTNIATAYTYKEDKENATRYFEEAQKFLERFEENGSRDILEKKLFLYRRMAQFHYINSIFGSGLTSAIHWMEKTVSCGKALLKYGEHFKGDHMRNLTSLAYMVSHKGDFTKTQHLLAEVQEMVQKHDDLVNEFMLSRIEIEEGNILLHQTKYADAEAKLRRGIKAYKAFSQTEHIPNLDFILIQVLIKQEKFDDALKIIDAYPPEMDFKNNIAYFYFVLFYFQKALIHLKKDDTEKFRFFIRVFIEKIKNFYTHYENEITEKLKKDFWETEKNSNGELMEKAKKLLDIFEKNYVYY